MDGTSFIDGESPPDLAAWSCGAFAHQCVKCAAGRRRNIRLSAAVAAIGTARGRGRASIASRRAAPVARGGRAAGRAAGIRTRRIPRATGRLRPARGGLSLGLLFGPRLRFGVRLLLRRLRLVHRLHGLGDRGRIPGFDGLGQRVAGLIILDLAVRGVCATMVPDKPYTAQNAPGFTLEAELGVGENAIPGPDFDIWELKAIKQKSLDRRYNHKVTLFTPQPDLPETGRLSTVDFVLKYGHVHTTDEDGNPTSYYFTSGDIQREGEDKPSAKLELVLEGFTDAKHFDPNGMIALYEKGTRTLAAGWSYLKLLGHWQRKHNRAAYVPYLREDNDGNTSVEFGPLVTLGISTSFGLFLQAFKDGKAVYDPGDKATLTDGRWTPHARSQFRINLNDIAAIYGEVREVDIRDPESY